MGKLPTFELITRYAVAADNALYQSRNRGSNMRWKGSSGGQASGSSQASTNTSGAAPMNVDTFERYKKLDETSKAQCFREGRCYFCRQKGHIAENCPKKNKDPNERRQ
ncbi:hypothetical protein Ndes2437B_g01070 [Nannochloris sp. 'desiccata']